MTDDRSTPWRLRAEPATLFEEAADQARELSTQDVRAVLLDPHGTYKWSRFRVNEVELEWRRWRLRHRLGFDDDPPASIRVFDRLAVAAGAPAADRSPAARERGGPVLEQSYDSMFPQGPVVAKAARGRVVRERTDRESDDEYAARMVTSARRRADYLALLDSDAYWWMIPDLLSSATAAACVRDVAGLHSGDGAAFAGGPEPGWDVEHDALVSTSSNAYLGQAPTLIQIHEDPVLVDLISQRMGRRMYPTRCTYLSYRDGDYLGVHTDQPTCEVSLLFTVDGEPGPLRSYFEQTAEDPAALDQWVTDRGHFPDGGRDFVYRPREGLALTGRAVPHARLPQDERAVIGALFYSGLT